MLIDFSVKNFGPFRDKAVLSLQRTVTEEHEENLIPCAAVGEEVLNSAAVFGSNSSGKSYIMYAVRALQMMVAAPLPANAASPWYQPFRLSSKTRDADVEMEMRFVTDGIFYHYALTFSRDRITSESLHYYPNGRKALVFTRTGGGFAFGRSLSKGQKAISEMTSANSTYLSVAAQFNNEVCLNAHRGMVQNIIVTGGHMEQHTAAVINMMNDNPRTKELLVRGMRIADFGISDIEGKVERKKLAEMSDVIPPQIPGMMIATEHDVISPKLMFKHDFSAADVKDSELSFPMQIESNGTKQMFCTMGPIIDALENGKTILIDEFGSSLHPEISRWIISQFKSESNPKGAQIIINTHDQTLMDTDFLFRRDQIFFTQKDPTDGSAEIYSLSDFKNVRKETNVQKNYSIGRYQAVPFISPDNPMGRY